MSAVPSVPEPPTPDASVGSPATSTHPSKPQRVLACVLCQQRKVKCDRKTPCSNCVKSRVQCVPATLTQRRRRRRFAERELLERLRKYEDLLRQNNIPFEPLHGEFTREKDSGNVDSDHESDVETAEAAGTASSDAPTSAKPGRSFKAQSVWHAMSHGFRERADDDSDSTGDDVRETHVRKVWDQMQLFDDHLLFGSRRTSVDLTGFHPDPVQIFRLWQVYLDNVNPLLKVTHTPSLQGRIIEAASNVKNIDPNLEALMFSIYCMAISSITAEECQTMFNTSAEDLLAKCQFGCQQALLNAGFLRTIERDCLTALFLYLLSMKPNTVPQSLSTILGIAIRIAQRMGIDSESTLAKYPILEAEMRRRLWWSLVLYDSRIGEVSRSRSVTLLPTWDCQIPLNVNDSDLRPEMKTVPTAQKGPSEALFAVLRGEVAEYIRHSACHLDFHNPSLKSIVKDVKGNLASDDEELNKLEERVENNYLKSCDAENPVHYVTIWTARTMLTKYRLMQHISKHPNSRNQTHRDAATLYALKMLQNDTKIMASPLSKRFVWLHVLQFPFPAYIQLGQDLRRRPDGEHVREAWKVMSDNWQAWATCPYFKDEDLFIEIFTKLIVPTWDACEAALEKAGENAATPWIVSYIKEKSEKIAQMRQNSETTQPDIMMDMGINDFRMMSPMPMGLPTPGIPYTMPTLDNMPAARTDMFPPPPIPGQLPPGGLVHPLWWNALGGRPGWGAW